MKSSLGRGDYAAEGKALCKVMMHDYIWYHKLKQLYPGSVYMLKYENLAQYPLEEASDVYSFIQKDFPKAVSNWIMAKMQGKNSGAFQTSRKNSTKTAFTWKSELETGQIRQLTQICRDVIRVYGYSLDWGIFVCVRVCVQVTSLGV